MARINVTGREVRALINSKLADLYLLAGNTAALSKLLNATDAVLESNTVLHPNRLHSILSDDVAQMVNERTVQLVDRAATELLASKPTITEQARQQASRLRAEAESAKLFHGADINELASKLDLPAAVARALFTPSSGGMADRKEPPAPDMQPDWSYQDIAVARCIDAFRRRPKGRIGLVLPTGAGKTRTALRIILSVFQEADPEAIVVWVTHRLNLRDQAHRELQKILASSREDALELNRFANRVKFTMLSEAQALFRNHQPKLALVVIDEAHHAASPTYRSMLEDIQHAPVLMLTATPNRTDQLPIGVDEIAYTITFRELAERGAVLMPVFEDFPVADFEWNPEQVKRLAEHVLKESRDRYTKTLVIAPRIDRIHEFYDALIQALPVDHPLELEDIGYIHSEGNSLNLPDQEFLARFSAKTRGVIVSAQMLLEGFDDPGINAVVITYPSSSVVLLMQAAGRSVRYAPGKAAAYVLQARNDSLAYHFDQRWLYQEISDLLRPELLDIEYGSEDELRHKLASVLDKHRIDEATRRRIEDAVSNQKAGDHCNLFLYGLPFFGQLEQFDTAAKWGALLETASNSGRLRAVFNGFCEFGAHLSDPSDYLATQAALHGFTRDLAPGSTWRQLSSLLTAAYFAKQEVYGSGATETPGVRPARGNGATTWLKYVTFKYRPQVPAALAEFLTDCHNRRDLEAAYLANREALSLAVKTPLPLAGFEGFLLDTSGTHALSASLEQLRLALSACEPQAQVGVLCAFLASSAVDLPNRLLVRLETLLPAHKRSGQTLHLKQPTM
jgi:superfamily II DNA or RNA helicase